MRLAFPPLAALIGALLMVSLAPLTEAAETMAHSVRISTQWPRSATSSFMETAEFLWDQEREEGAAEEETTSHPSFWKYLDEITAAGTPLPSWLPRDATPESNVLLNASLAMGLYAPSLEQQRVLAAGVRRNVRFLADSACEGSGEGAYAVVETDDFIFATCSPAHLSVEGERSLSNEEKETCSSGFHDESEGARRKTRRLMVVRGDHVSPLAEGTKEITTIIVNGELASPAFAKLYRAARDRQRASPQSTRLIVRFATTSDAETTTTRHMLGGFSVTMDVKNTEYVSMDESTRKAAMATGGSTTTTTTKDELGGVNFGVLYARLTQAGMGEEGGKSANERVENLKREVKKETEKVKPWEMRNLGIQAAMYVFGEGNAASEDVLSRLGLVSHYFPLHTRRLLAMEGVERFPSHVLRAAAESLGGLDGLFVNGVRLPAEVNAYLDFLSHHLRDMRTAAQLNLTRTKMEALVEALPAAPGAGRQSQGEEELANPPPPLAGERIDMRKNGKGAVVFLNDVEKDKTFSRWSTSPDALSGPFSPHSPFARFRKNLYTVVVAINDTSTSPDVLRAISYFIRAGAPVRFGVTIASSAAARRLRGLDDERLDAVEMSEAEEDGYPETEAESRCGSACFVRLLVGVKKEHGLWPAIEILTQLMERARAGGGKGISKREAAEVVKEVLVAETGSWTGTKFVRLAEELMRRGGDAEKTVRRMARYVGTLNIPVHSLTMNGIVVTAFSELRVDAAIFPLVMQEQAWLTSARDGFDWSKDVLLQILEKAKAKKWYSTIATTPFDQRTFASLPSSADDVAIPPTIRLVLGAVVENACGATNSAAEKLLEGSETLTKMKTEGSVKVISSLSDADEKTKTCPVSTSTSATTPVLVLNVNGRVIRVPINDEEIGLDPRDLDAILEDEARRLDRLEAAVAGAELSVPALLRLIPTLSDIYKRELLFAKKNLHSHRIEDRGESFTGYFDREIKGGYPFAAVVPPPSTAPKTELSSTVRVVLICDPVSPASQRNVALAQWLNRRIGVPVRVIVVPRLEMTELPTPNYFAAAFGEASATFPTALLPAGQLLTMKLSTPQTWIAYPRDFGGKDPDNIIVARGETLVGEYELAHMLIEGHALVKSSGMGEPATGMRLELVDVSGGVTGGLDNRDDDDENKAKDSTVMQNLGYWQFKASPGVWILRTAPDSSYVLDEGSGGASGLLIPLNRFDAAPLELEAVVKTVDLVNGSMAAASNQGVGRRGGSGDGDGDDDTVHIFSLASGALYERFLRIMILSARKQTSGKLKFWLLENYMSREMKDFLPRFASKYDFSYELVTYKWPDWLRGQEERQRQIWGMKILFLDVLFPLGVNRVIYVDSDQVLRADLRELWKLDLQGAPYAFTPFCDSRKETLGFQFWRSGYWANHLRGLPYHISALFVVDLRTFRALSVGDRLRAIYHQLSAEPGSLSNLDQDLPNYAQHDIPIFSLPQEWLWCESWCSDESKKRAKTIDLCNNPLHKEPKLDMARRVIRGELFAQSWDELDAEVRELFDERRSA